MANNNKTDYNKAFMDLAKLLPEPLQSDVNISLFNNVFNRYLTKPETEKVSGYIGQGNTNAIVSRQIHENSVHRQAYQLQPIPYSKVGSVEHMASWKDIQNELTRLGVDMEDFAQWGATQSFNWVPPIDINKIINYRDYYWVGGGTPQYITIRSTCTNTTARLNFWESLIQQFGSTFPVEEIAESDIVTTDYTITSLSPSAIVVNGDATDDILDGNFINVESTASNNGVHQVSGDPVYDGSTNKTTITVSTTVVTETPPVTAKVTLRRYNKIIVGDNGIGLNGDYTELFVDGFVFFYRSSPNAELNNSFLEASGSTYDADTQQTTITIKTAVTDNTTGGSPSELLSLEEQLSVYQVDKDCQCGEFGGWDIGLWDDNPLDPLWGDSETASGSPGSDGISDHTNLIDRISNVGAPTAAGADGELWYDTLGDTLYQYRTASPGAWFVIWNNFSLLLDQTNGFILWDMALECDTRPRIDASSQWSEENFWFHKNDVTNFVSAIRAVQPIIEYDWDLELNEWSYTNYRWSYRSEADATFEETDANPPLIELEPLIWWENDSGNTILFDDRYGDLTDYFVEGRTVNITTDTVTLQLTVDYSEYKSSPSTHPYRTFVTFTTLPPVSTGNLADATPSRYTISPTDTVAGDTWAGYGLHWLFLGADDPLPVPHQSVNPYIEIDNSAPVTQVYSDVSPSVLLYEYTTSLYSQNYYLVAANQREFLLTDAIPSNTSRPLTRRALYGHNDVRVYSSDAAGEDVEREYGTFDEIGETVFNVVDIDYDTNEFILGGTDQQLIGVDFTTYFTAGDTIKLEENSGVGTEEFVVTNVSGNRIEVNGSPNTNLVEGTIFADGFISNVTTPVPTDDFVNSRNVTQYTIGVEFFADRLAATNVQIIVGESAIRELGSYTRNVRTVENDTQYNTVGDIPISTISYRKVEQLKTRTNQYPLFDVFTVLGEPAYRVSSIFGYRTSGEEEINQQTGLRIVYDEVNDIYEFDQFLLDEDNGELFAYRDYANMQNDYWYNFETQEVFFWDEITWSDKIDMDGHYRKAVVSSIEPSSPEADIDGLYWYNTTTNRLYMRDISVPSWVEVTGVDRTVSDINLQTIWKSSDEDNLYIPTKEDWERRTEAEYNTERDEFIVTRTEELLDSDPSLSEPDAILQATEEWYESQVNHLSSTGAWIGDWHIPEPLYYNHLHENKKYLTSRELLGHFTTIIESQADLPGFSGSKSGLFNIIPLNDVNYAAGGTIKEFNNGFDTLISSTFVDNVTPRSLIEFAHDQYESSLNTIKELFRADALELLTDLEPENIIDFSTYAAEQIINAYELNDLAAFLYGDSTTFIDNDGVNDLGVRNWIATLPFLLLVYKIVPERIYDDNLGLDEVLHHDGHRNGYVLTDATKDVIARTLITLEDSRTDGDPLGVGSTSQPPNDITEFDTEFNSVIGREGVYWYNTQTDTLYRYLVVASTEDEPSLSYDDGTLWMDLTSGSEVLRIKRTNFNGDSSWEIVNGLTLGDGRLHNGANPTDISTATISAWQEVDLNTVLNDIIFNLESRLYEAAPLPSLLNYDFEATAENYPTKYLQYLHEAFLDYVSQSEIESPFENTGFVSSDPFTWNYKRSANNGAITIVDSDDTTNSFVVTGDRTAFFDPCTASAICPSTVSFYVKNSLVNNGTWTTIESTLARPATSYDAGQNTTTVFVDGDVLNDVRGVIYSGTLPSSENDGSESGGYWKDLYEKFYGTPYPHREPWILQGYDSKPSWWDTEYLNDDIRQWGDRTWKYKHGFAITGANSTEQYFNINGNFHDLFVSLGSGALASTYSFSVDSSVDHEGDYNLRELNVIQTVNPGAAGFANVVVDDTSGFASSTFSVGMVFSITTPGATTYDSIIGTYTVKSVSLVGTTFTIVVEEEIEAGDITAGTDFISGAVFTPSTNTTTIFIDGLSSPAVTPITADTIEGRITTVLGMWENIRTGIIPAGQTYPNGLTSVTGNPSTDRTVYGISVQDLPTYNYFSVNIDNVRVSDDGGTTYYYADDVLPPYWDYRDQYTATPASIDIPVRSIYFDFSTEIISPNADYIFGDAGPVEWVWRSSSQYLYDQLTVAYRLDPANFLYRTFGFNFTAIGGLLIDRDVKNTASHSRTNFHGDVVDNEQFTSNGLNQWYVNFNRYEGYDANFSNFQPLWVNWTAPLTYQFSSFVDTPSLSVAHRYVDLTNSDYAVTSKSSPGATDYWLDAFKVQIINIPYDIARYDNQLDWRFDVRTNLSISREITYYDVHNYQFYADPDTDEMKLYTWEVIDLDTTNNTFTINGDQEDIFAAGRQFEITGSTGNDGTYTIYTSTYDSVADQTVIEIEGLIPDFRKDGLITLIYRSLPWETGYGVYLSTSELLPIPLDGDTIIGLTKYFIIKTSDNTFKLALTESDAYADNAIDITTTGTGDHFVGDVLNTFTVDTVPSINWRQYAIDKNNVLTWSTPKQVQGMQPFIDIIRGYDSYELDNGWIVNADRTLRDPDSGDIISWQVELERFIAYAYATRTRRNAINDRYPVTVDDATNEWTFLEDTTDFITGDPVIVLSSNTIYPTPISRGIRYYMIRDSIETFRLAASRVDALEGIAIDILPTASVGDLVILAPNDNKHLIPAFELNAFRNAIWFRPEYGIVSNVITGPTSDIRTTQLIFDQEGNVVGTDQLRVYRLDKETKIVVVNGETVPEDNMFINDTYNELRLGGLHIFTDTYEHVMMFDNYSAGGDLLYDPFIGLNVTKYEMLFNRNPEDTRRPNVGGYYLETFYNQNADIKENIEAGADSLRKAYDAHTTFESDLMTTQSRKSLGYQGTVEYLDNLNMSEKSQFLFWRGQIQTKGSINAVKAYINSRRFIDAKIDDFWAVKLGSFGSVAEREFPEMFVYTVDARSNEFKAEFIDNDVDESTVDDGFTAIKMSDTDRWYNQPDQDAILRNNGKVLYFDMKPVSKRDDITDGDKETLNGDYIVHGLNVDALELTHTDITNPDGTLADLIEGIDYNYVNPYIVEIINPTIWGNIEGLTIYGLVANTDAQNPARIMDRKAEVQLSNIEYWDPARGQHYSNAIHNVDLQNDNDPAVYNNTIQTISDTRLWVGDKAGTTWLDTSAMFYVPYHSDTVISDRTTRFRQWGKLHDFSRVKIYEWVESDVAPSEWDAIAEEEEGDNTIDESIRKSGRAKYTLFEPAGSGSPTDWIPLKDKVDVQYAATDGTGFTTFTPDTSIIDNTKAIDVYINETNYTTVEPVGSPAILPTTVILPTTEADIVKFVQGVPTDEDTIAEEIAAGNLRQEYEYVTTEEVDALGNTVTTYYFWVEDKGTKPSGRNRTLTAADSQVDLVTMPAAHMFYQKPLTDTIISETDVTVNRVEYFNQPSAGSPLVHAYELGLVIDPTTTPLVEIDGVDIDPSLVSYVTAGSPSVTTVYINLPVTGSPPENRVKITYTGLYTSYTTIPNRYTQVIVRGLQGVVFSDDRYTIQFTRDFTLRDTIDVENEDLGSNELKNYHEEWQLIRQEQTNNIDRWLWNRVIECIIGYKLDDMTVRVPSLERELYDDKYGTDTQYGLDEGQAFANGTLALASVIAYLLDPDVDFTPIDINTFFELYNFDTDENIIEAMNVIYDTFSFTHVNRIFFSVLHDAFTTKSKYPDIFKTSMISLHGIRPFQTAGVFDD